MSLRFALRQLLKTPGFTLVAVLTLAVGIGASSAMFSSLRALVLQPFSYRDADRLAMVWSGDGWPLSIPDWFDLYDKSTSFSEFGVYTPRSANLGGEHPESIVSVASTSGVLRAYGIQPQLGRWFEPADDQPGAPAVVVISHRLWQRTFGGDPGLVGRSIRVDGTSVTVIGIMPADFEFASPWMRTDTCDLWSQLGIKRGEGDRGSHWLCGIARLKPGVTAATADSEIKAIGKQLSATYPNTNTQKHFLVRSLHEEMAKDVQSRAWMLFGAVSLVLLVACANVASMLLARNARRQAEFGVRTALGAGRRQIAALVLGESVILALIGGVLGLLVAYAGCRLLGTMMPVSEARRAAISLDLPTAAFAIGAALFSALLAGLPPVLATGRISVSELLRTDGRGAAGSRARHRLLRALVVAQVAIALLLANGAALFSAAYVRLLAANESLKTDRALSAEFNLHSDRYKDSDARARMWDQVAARAAALPGVTAAGLTSKLPLEGGSNMNVLVNDEVFDPSADRMLAEISSITPGYFAAAGIPLLRGRTLEPGDAGPTRPTAANGAASPAETANAPRQIGVVVNRALAEKCWPGKDPIGQIIRPSRPTADFHARVVGVVENVRQWGPDSDPRPEIFWTADRAWGRRVFLVMRSQQSASGLAKALRQEIHALDPELPASRIRTLATVVDEAMLGQRIIVQLVNAFMAVALGLVAVGLYGTLSYHVLQRTREFGVRMAIGASRGSVIALVFRQGGGWVAVGMVIGTAGAIGATYALQSLVFGLHGIEPLSLLLACLAVVASAAVACWLPAWRAARLDPITALRAD